VTVVAVGVFAVAYVLIATERIHKTAAALGGAAIVLALGVMDSHDAFYSRETGIDWDVIFLLFGMMSSSGCCARPVYSSTPPSGRPSAPRDPRFG